MSLILSERFNFPSHIHHTREIGKDTYCQVTIVYRMYKCLRFWSAVLFQMECSLKWDIFKTQNGSSFHKFEDWIFKKQNFHKSRVSLILSAHKQNLNIRYFMKINSDLLLNILTSHNIEISHFIHTSFYMKCKTRLNCVKQQDIFSTNALIS